MFEYGLHGARQVVAVHGRIIRHQFAASTMDSPEGHLKVLMAHEVLQLDAVQVAGQALAPHVNARGIMLGERQVIHMSAITLQVAQSGQHVV